MRESHLLKDYANSYNVKDNYSFKPSPSLPQNCFCLHLLNTLGQELTTTACRSNLSCCTSCHLKTVFIFLNSYILNSYISAYIVSSILS